MEAIPLPFNCIYNNIFNSWRILMGDNRIIALSEYQISMETIVDSDKSTMVVSLKYPKNWKVIKPDETSNIKTFSDGGSTYYWVEDSVDISSILDLIDDTIELNKDLEERVKLLQAKVEELKDIFMEEDLEKLKKIRFVFTSPRGRKPSTKKTTTTKKKEEKVDLKKDDKKVDQKDESKASVDDTSIKTDEEDKSKSNIDTTSSKTDKKDELKTEVVVNKGSETEVEEQADDQSIDDKIAEAINDKNTERND